MFEPQRMSTTEYLPHSQESRTSPRRAALRSWDPAMLEYGRALWAQLPRSAATPSRQLWTLGLTSSGPGEGVSTVALHLALAAASAAKDRVLLIDANTDRPSLHGAFGIPPAPGLCELCEAPSQWSDTVWATEIENLAVLTAGNDPYRPRLVPLDISGVLAALRERFDVAIIDLPPAARNGFTLRCSGILDGTILVIEAERACCDAVREARQWLSESSSRLIGAVLNRRREPLPPWLDRIL